VNTASKGRRLERLAKQVLEAKGYLVEMAPNRMVHLAAGRVISQRRDWFGVWDLCAVKHKRRFVQVTTVDGVSARRRKIIASGFPCTPHDLLMGYVGGRGRHFRVYVGPAFDGEWEEWPI